jgi:hypothetical protein
VAGAAGLEPTTCGLEDRCSIQLSYAPFGSLSTDPGSRGVSMPRMSTEIERGESSAALRGVPLSRRGPPPPVARTTARCRGHSRRDAFPCPSAGERGGHGKEKWPRRPAVARGIERGESSAGNRAALRGVPLSRRGPPPLVARTTARCRGHSWRDAFPCPSAREKGGHSWRDAFPCPSAGEKGGHEKKSAHGVPPWCGESSAGNGARPRGAPLSRRGPPPLVAHTTARCRGHSWRDAFLRPSAREKGGHSWRDAFPCHSAREKGGHGKEKWPRRPAVARGIERGESSGVAGLPCRDACCLPLAACRLPPAACRLPPAACRLPPAACRLPTPPKAAVAECPTGNGCRGCDCPPPSRGRRGSGWDRPYRHSESARSRGR